MERGIEIETDIFEELNFLAFIWEAEETDWEKFERLVIKTEQEELCH